MRSGLVLLPLVLAWLALAGIATAEERTLPQLRFDPFAAPDPSRLAAADAVEAELDPIDDGWSATLRGTLVAGEHSLANLGGVVLGLGDESHGYRLLEVRPFEAVFERAGERVVLEVERQRGGDAP